MWGPGKGNFSFRQYLTVAFGLDLSSAKTEKESLV